jgi:hypothetical protein
MYEYVINEKQEILGRTNQPLFFDMAWITDKSLLMIILFGGRM